MANACDFGIILRKLRKCRNLTQSELGALVGLSKAVISKYENCLGYPTFDVLIRIAECFGVSTDYLLGVHGTVTIDLAGLTESQIDIVDRIVKEFRNENVKFQSHKL